MFCKQKQKIVNEIFSNIAFLSDKNNNLFFVNITMGVLGLLDKREFSARNDLLIY
jgi:hypothetical protein